MSTNTGTQASSIPGHHRKVKFADGESDFWWRCHVPKCNTRDQRRFEGYKCLGCSRRYIIHGFGDWCHKCGYCPDCKPDSEPCLGDLGLSTVVQQEATVPILEAPKQTDDRAKRALAALRGMNMEKDTVNKAEDLDDLERLAKMRDLGIISEGEFQEHKERILALI
jgi:hypothetical protein